MAICFDGADIKHVVNDFLGKSTDKDVVELSTSLRSLSNQSQTDLIHKILDTITDNGFHTSLFKALSTHISDHPFETAVFLIVVVLLSMPNPVVAGFIILGSVKAVGSLVELWTASSGGISAASNAIILLQGWGMLVNVVLPAAGKVTGAVSAEVGKWGSGQYGTPVENWMRGDYGRPVEKWMNGDYGNPVLSWFGSILK